jgi:DMSO reductase family type II enzyme heme b subunit
MDPMADEWTSASSEIVQLQPTPIGSQPSHYVINSWREKPYGESGLLEVSSAHNGEALFFRLSWTDPTQDDRLDDTDRFGDGAAVLLPVVEGATLQSMGSFERPVNAWYWRADLDAPHSVMATGFGTTVRQSNGSIAADARYEDRAWHVVLARPFDVDAEGTAPLQPGMSTQAGFAVWQGSNRERAGIKAASAEWEPLEIEV